LSNNRRFRLMPNNNHYLRKSRMCPLAYRLAALVVLAAAPLVGCSSPAADGYPLSGTVTYQGAPLPRGTILFRPDSSQGNSGQALAFTIKDGAYGTSDDQPRLHHGGHYQVRINGYDGSDTTGENLPMGRPLFQDYNTTVELPPEEATDTNFVVER